MSMIDKLVELLGKGRVGALDLGKGGIRNVVAWGVKLLSSTPIMGTAKAIGKIFGIDAEDWLVGKLSGWLEGTGSAPTEAVEKPEGTPARLLVQQELILRNSQTGKAMLEQVRASGIAVKPGNPGQSAAFFGADQAGKPVVLAGSTFAARNLPSLITALRAASQDRVGLSGNSGLSPEGQVFYDRFARADAEALAVQICYELMKAGQDKPWKILRGNFHGRLMSDAYLDAMDADPAADTSGAALRATFDRWFQLGYPEKISVEQSLARLSANPPAQPAGGWRPLLADDLRRLGLVSGTNYLNNGRDPTDAHYKMDMTADQAQALAALAGAPPAPPPSTRHKLAA